MSARRPIFNALVAPLAGGPVSHEQAQQMLDAYRCEELLAAAAELDRIADETEKRVAEHYGTASGIGPGSADMVREAARTIRDRANAKPTATPNPTPIPIRWDRTVIHPALASEDDTIVCCSAMDDGRPVALFLDDEYREALGLQLVDPHPDDTE
jgi:hypothetical protein